MLFSLLSVLIVACIAAGQLLFKLSAQTMSEDGSFFAPKAILILLAALVLYGASTLGWVWILQKAELGRVYPVMALSFVLVPAGSHLLFGEVFNGRYFFGIAFIMLGIVLTVRA